MPIPHDKQIKEFLASDFGTEVEYARMTATEMPSGRVLNAWMELYQRGFATLVQRRDPEDKSTVRYLARRRPTEKERLR